MNVVFARSTMTSSPRRSTASARASFKPSSEAASHSPKHSSLVIGRPGGEKPLRQILHCPPRPENADAVHRSRPKVRAGEAGYWLVVAETHDTRLLVWLEAQGERDELLRFLRDRGCDAENERRSAHDPANGSANAPFAEAVLRVGRTRRRSREGRTR